MIVIANHFDIGGHCMEVSCTATHTGEPVPDATPAACKIPIVKSADAAFTRNSQFIYLSDCDDMHGSIVRFDRKTGTKEVVAGGGHIFAVDHIPRNARDVWGLRPRGLALDASQTGEDAERILFVTSANGVLRLDLKLGRSAFCDMYCLFVCSEVE